MKELSIEQKAKRYDEAIEKARQLCAYPTTKPFISDLQDIFPELKENKESEDENTRKAVLKAFKIFAEKQAYVGHCLDDIDWDKCIAWIEKQGEQKPADKVEPKFKVGDWIVSNGHLICGNSLMRVVKVGLTDYLCRYCNGQTTYCREFIDKSYHLWTIQDAKDGDVLATDSGVCIFDGTLEEDKYPFAYCGITKRGFESYNGNLPFSHDNNIHPATKEQRDLLFQKMKEAGYEWDADKKELKKVEFNLDGLIEESYQQQADDLIDMVTRKSLWSEEDEKILNLIIARLHSHPNVKAEEYGKDYHWFKSFKERIQPQQQEWSEEDEKDFNTAIQHIENYVNNTPSSQRPEIWADITKLKSLKERYIWKPSDVQMDAVKDAIDYLGGNTKIVRKHLMSLYGQLKKLREG